jgi:hypothetical protein
MSMAISLTLYLNLLFTLLLLLLETGPHAMMMSSWIKMHTPDRATESKQSLCDDCWVGPRK